MHGPWDSSSPTVASARVRIVRWALSRAWSPFGVLLGCELLSCLSIVGAWSPLRHGWSLLRGAVPAATANRNTDQARENRGGDGRCGPPQLPERT